MLKFRIINIYDLVQVNRAISADIGKEKPIKPLFRAVEWIEVYLTALANTIEKTVY